MINASKEFKEKLKKGGRIVNYADITLSNGTVLHLTYKDFMASGGCAIEDKTTDGKFGVGFTIGKTVKITIANHDERFSDYDFYNSIINLYVAMQLDDGRIEKIRKGVYYSMVPATSGEVIEISAVDGMWKLDKDYSVVNTAYPATLQTIITDICSVCGIPIGFRHFDNMSFMVNERPYNLTCRRVLSCAAQIAGYNARIDNDGYMQLVWYNTDIVLTYISGGDFRQYPHDTVIDGGDFKNYRADTIIDGGLFTDEQPEHIYSVKSLNVCTDDVQITGVRVEKKATSTEEKDTTVLFGEEGYVIEVKENPLTLGKENEVANFLGGKIVGMVFRPFSAEIPGNPLYEPFDTVKVSDRKGNAYLSFLNSIVYTVGGYAQVACEAEDPLRNGSVYFSQAAAAVAEARRNAEQQITEYDHAVQNMNQLVANSMGIYAEKEWQPDGSAIYYESNKPITVDEDGKCHFEPGSTVWMKSDNGFFISNDGGKPGTFESGWDKNGILIANIIHTIALYADQITTGRLEAKKGDKTTFFVDVDAGQVKIVADEFSLSSGQTIDSIAQDKANGALKDAKNYADDAVDTYDIALTQQKVFNKLTNNGQTQGIYLENGKLYINAEYIKTGTMSADRIRTGLITDEKGYNYWNLSTGEFKLSSSTTVGGKTVSSIAEDAAESAASTAISNYDSGLNQQKVFNKLTNNGQTQGIYLSDGKLYLNAEYIASGSLSADRIKGGTLEIGGNGNSRGEIKIYDSYGYLSGWVDSDGIMLAKNRTGTNSASAQIFIDGRNISLNSFSNNYTEIHSNVTLQLVASSNIYSAVPSSNKIIFAVGGQEKGYFGSSGLSLNSPTSKSGLRNLGLSGTTGTVYVESNSTKRHKDILKNMIGEDCDCIYDISPVWAKYKDGYLDKDDERNGVYYPMLIAEDVDEHIPFAANHDSDGLADDWNYRVLIPYMIQTLKEQKKEIDSLKAKILEMERRQECGD